MTSAISAGEFSATIQYVPHVLSSVLIVAISIEQPKVHLKRLGHLVQSHLTSFVLYVPIKLVSSGLSGACQDRLGTIVTSTVSPQSPYSVAVAGEETNKQEVYRIQEIKDHPIEYTTATSTVCEIKARPQSSIRINRVTTMTDGVLLPVKLILRIIAT